MRILVTGGNGQLGSEFSKFQKNNEKDEWFLMSISELDITNSLAVEHFIKTHEITHLINTAAYTNVEQAEEEEEVAFRVNAKAVKNMAKLAKKYELTFIHISTDYVFDGSSSNPYSEDAVTNPINVYGASKLKGEAAILEIAPKNAAILRTSWLYGANGNNFVKTILSKSKELKELNVINDQFGAITNASDLATVIYIMLSSLKNEAPEIFHFSNEGICTWFDVAEEIVAISGVNCTVKPVSTEFYKTKAKRPKFSKLDSTKIKNDFGVEIPEWKARLKKYLSDNH